MKRGYRWVWLLSLVALAGPANALCPEDFGDLDGSGATSVVDVQCGLVGLLWTLGGSGEAPACLAGGPPSLDVDCDLSVDVSDVQILIARSLGLALAPIVDGDSDGCPDACQSDEPVPELQFVGNRVFRQLGSDRAPGGPLASVAELVMTIQTWPGSLNHSVTAYYTVDEFDSVEALPMAFVADAAGEFGNNYEWSAAIPASELPPGATLHVWFMATDGTSELYDSQSGANFVFPLLDEEAQLAPTYSRIGKYSFSKCWWDGENCTTGWQYSPNLANPFSATYSQYQVYGAWPHLSVEIYIPGITDAAAGDATAALAMNDLVRVRVASALFEGAPTAPVGAKEIPRTGSYGNNAVYQWQFFASGCTCPVGMGWPEAGLYDYEFEVSIDAGQTWQPLVLDGVSGEGGPLVMDWQLIVL